MNSKFYFLLFLIAFGLKTTTTAQDNHFSQFYNAPLMLNPALTGLFMEDLRFTAQYRNQWNSVSIPFQTMAASADMKLITGIAGDDFFGGGLVIMNDVAGDARFRNLQTQLSFSYNKDLNGQANQYLSAGGQVGFGQRAVNTNALFFDSQFDGAILNSNISSGENIDRNTFTYLDVSAGLAWFYAPTQKSSYYIGASLSHLNRPNMSFYSNSNDPLERKLTLHAGFQFPVTDDISLIPRAVIFNQGGLTEINIGGMFKFNFDGGYSSFGDAAFYIGSMARVRDALVVLARVDYNNFGLGASYDINTSDLSAASQGNGGFEVALTYKIMYNGYSGGPMGCPTF